MNIPRLYAIVDVEACARSGRRPIDVTHSFLSAGVGWLQLRAKTMNSGALVDLAREMAAACRQGDATLIVNDRADVAAIVSAHGVHLGQDDLPPRAARRVVGQSMLVGVSTHTEPQIRAAAEEPVSYLAVGPVFGTATKDTGYAAVGLNWVRRAATIAQVASLPLVAIGGITLDNAASVIAHGADSVAVIGDLLVGDPESRARAFVNALK